MALPAPDIPLTPEALTEQARIGELALWGRTSTEALLVWTLRTATERRERTDLWLAPWTSGPERRLTESPGHDTRPVFRPDGSAVAFLRQEGSGPAQVWQTDPAGGAVRQLGSFPNGALDLAWSPDGLNLAVLAEEEQAAEEVPAPQGTEGSGEPTCRTVGRADWRQDGVGLRLRTRRLFLLDPATGVVRPLTAGAWSASRPRFGADGLLYFLADPGLTGRPAHPERPQVHRLDPAYASGTRAPEEVAALPGGVERFHAPDGAGDLTLFGYANAPVRDGDPLRAWRQHADGRRTELLPDRRGLWLGAPGGTSDLFDWNAEPDDTPRAAVLTTGGEAVPVDLDDGSPLVAGRGRVVCSALASCGAGVAAVMTLGTGVLAPEVYALGPGGPRRISRLGSAWLEARPRPRVEAADFQGRAGRIGAWVVQPLTVTATEPPPAVLLLHGGPTEQWEAVPPLEAALLAGAGFRVVLPNLRGSTDQGSAWASALRGHWGEADADDVEAVCDQLVARGWADPARLGVCGLSYGGFLVNWLIGTTDRFAAAVSENGVTNQVSAWANSDVGPSYADAADLGDPLSDEGLARLWLTSPLRHVTRIRAPLLLLQAEADLRCPPADNEQLFQALLRLGRPVQYVTYPEESHLFQGIGRIDRRIDRHRRVLDHFRRHLSG